LYNSQNGADFGHGISASKLFAQLSRATSRSEIEAALACITRRISQQDKLEELASLSGEAVSLGDRIIMREGVDGGVVTRTEYMIAQLASEEKLTKRTTNRVIKLVKRDDFVPAEIRTDRIQQIESWIEKADGGTIFEYDVWKEGDGQQDLKLYIRNLRTILEDLIADEQYAGYQYHSFELVERDNCRSFGPANSSVWWQINAELIGPDKVLLGIIVFTDGSWNKKKLSCESVYSKPSSLFFCLL